jgi:protein-L-isoaspartate(D-aspartate) O-methyltransferase
VEVARQDQRRINPELERSELEASCRLCQWLFAANGIIRSDAVESAMLAVDRGNYSRNNPYMDAPQGIGYGVTISAPHMHAHALELLKDKLMHGDRALDVGSGSGYLTACMAIMLGEKG